MMCDKCVKKSVCKLCDGGNIQGCIEFYRPHEKILQEIRQEIERIAVSEYKDAYTCIIRTGDQVKNMVIKLIDNKIKELSE